MYSKLEEKFCEHAPVVQLEESSNTPHESEDEEFAEVVGFQDAFLFLAWYETVKKVARLSQKHAYLVSASHHARTYDLSVYFDDTHLSDVHALQQHHLGFELEDDEEVDVEEDGIEEVEQHVALLR